MQSVRPKLLPGLFRHCDLCHVEDPKGPFGANEGEVLLELDTEVSPNEFEPGKVAYEEAARALRARLCRGSGKREDRVHDGVDQLPRLEGGSARDVCRRYQYHVAANPLKRARRRDHGGDSRQAELEPRPLVHRPGPIAIRRSHLHDDVGSVDQEGRDTLPVC